jgi:hypothetical protein
VTFLPGVGQGFFDDRDPRIYSVGSDPQNIFIGPFNDQEDLLTVNAGSSDLTLISDFEGASPVVTTIAAGGVDPTTAFDFSTGDGFEDLVVGNTGGALALFEGGPEGLALISVEEEPDLPDPTSLAFSALTDGSVDFYAATAGHEDADLLAMSLSSSIEPGPGTGGESPGSPVPGQPTGPGTDGPSVTSPFSVSPTVTGTVGSSPGSSSSLQLVALHDSSLPLVATVLTLSLELSSEETGPGAVESGASVAVALMAGPGTSAGQGPLSMVRGGGSAVGPTEGADEPGAVETGVPTVLSPWQRFVLGLDEALEELERQGAGETMGPSEPVDRPDSQPGLDLPAQGRGAGVRSVPERPAGAEDEGTDVPMPVTPATVIDATIARPQEPRQPISRRDIRLEAIDAAIARLAADRAGNDTGDTDRPIPRPRQDEPGLVGVGLTVSLLAGTWARPQKPTRRPGFARRRQGSPVRRCHHVII